MKTPKQPLHKHSSKLSTFFKQVTLPLLYTITLMFGINSYADTLTARVDRQTINSQEPLQLTLIYQGSSGRKLNFDVLENDFEVLTQNKSSSTQMSFSNGSGGAFVSSTEWRLLLMPKRSGKITLPAFVIDGVNSQPITIEVKASDAPKTQRTDHTPIYLETEISTAKPYTQQQLLFSIRLISEYQIVQHDFEQNAPIIPDARVEQVYIGQYQRMYKGQQQLVLEKIYAIYPQSAGALRIPAVPHAVIFQKPGKDPRFSFLNRGNRIRKDFQSDVQTLHVQKKPSRYSGSTWLPAEKITLEEHWSSSPKNFVVGEPITRDITIKAKGLLASQLPELSMSEMESLKLYPDQPQLDNQRDNTGITSTRSLATAIVPEKAGHYTLPAINVDWWDVSSQKQRRASLPEVEIFVVAAHGGNADRSESEPQDLRMHDVEPQTQNLNANIEYDNSMWRVFWPLSSAALLLLTLTFATLWLRKRSQLATLMGRSAEQKDYNGNNHSGRTLCPTEKQILKTLQRHCKSGLLSAIRHTLIQWGRERWPQAKIQSLHTLLQQLTHQTDGKALAGLIQQLDEMLYSDHAADNTAFNAMELYKLVCSLDPGKSKNSKKQMLRALYR